MSGTAEMNARWAEWIVDELVRCGVSCFCVASGSRSSPLALALARHPGAESVVHFDERGAAFYALGRARAARRAVGWLTTSGTAAANGLPAVVEASQSGVPLVVITADRPPELRETGANQTIDQVKLFGGYARWAFDFPCPTGDMAEAAVRRTVAYAASRAAGAPAGPVHLNCMFREPLVAAAAAGGRTAGAGGEPSCVYVDACGVDEARLQGVADALRAGPGVVVAGQCDDPAAAGSVAALAEALRWPLIADIASGLRLGGCSTLIPYADLMLTSERAAAALKPAVILQVGGPVTSRRIQRFLAGAGPAPYIHVEDGPFRRDPAHVVTLRVRGPVAAVCRALARNAGGAVAGSEWLNGWMGPQAAIAAELESVVRPESAVSEPGVARAVSTQLPAGHGLFLGSSMPVRDMDAYAAAGAPRRAAANRGASGIDGTLASAAGWADGLGCPVTCVCGDLAALHDLNSLALVRRTRQPLTLVVINNDGGGIFSFLPVAEHADAFESHFATPHGLGFKPAADMFGLPCRRPVSMADFTEAYRAALDAGKPALIEVRTWRDENVKLHREVERRVRAAVESV